MWRIYDSFEEITEVLWKVYEYQEIAYWCSDKIADGTTEPEENKEWKGKKGSHELVLG